MKILLTGSEGFLGTSLKNYFYLNYPQYDFICVDRKLGIEVTDVKSLSGVDFVIHLAAQPSVFNSDLTQIQKDNIDSFKYICDLAKISNTPFIFASSATACERNISSFYGESKKINEDYAAIHYPDAIGLRFHNIYAKNPRQGTILQKLLEDNEILLVNNGQTTRHFTYITDITEAIAFVVREYNKLAPGIYNVLNPESNTILDLSQEVQKYRPELKIKLTKNIEGRDTIFQYVDTELPTIPINYKTIQEGIYDIFCTHILD